MNMKEDEQVKILKESYLQIMKWTVRIIKPWKVTNPLEHENPDYANGWNDCIKELTKNAKKLIKEYKDDKISQS